MRNHLNNGKNSRIMKQEKGNTQPFKTRRRRSKLDGWLGKARSEGCKREIRVRRPQKKGSLAGREFYLMGNGEKRIFTYMGRKGKEGGLHWAEALLRLLSTRKFVTLAIP